MAYAKSEQTRARLLKSAAKLLRTQGYAATGLRDIVADSGVPKGSLYHHFPGGKQDLAAASVRHAGAYIHGALEQLADEAGDPVRAMALFCEFYIAQLRGSDFQKGCPLATVALEAAPHIEPVQIACAEAFDGIVAQFRTRLRDRGVTHDEADMLAEFTVAAIEGALLLAKAKKSTRPIEVVRDELAERLKRALRDAQTPSSQGDDA